MTSFDVIVACCNKNGIGKDGDLPWKLKKEIAHFKDLTTEAPAGYRNVVIMGRNTWESIPEKFKPLPNRYNIILTSKYPYLTGQKFSNQNVRTYRSLQDALDVLGRIKHKFKYNKIFIIGGENVYEEAIKNRYCNNIYMTKIYNTFECDRFFPKIMEAQFESFNVNCQYISDANIADD